MSIEAISNPIEQSVEVTCDTGKLLNIASIPGDEEEDAHIIVAIYNDGYEQENGPSAWAKITPGQFAHALQEFTSFRDSLVTSPLEPLNPSL